MLIEYRESHNLTQQEMANLLGISVSSYNLYENHKREMTFDTLIKFLKLRDEGYDEEAIKIIEKFKRWFGTK